MTEPEIFHWGATERPQSHYAWKAEVTIRWKGHAWKTDCRHNHRTIQTAEKCAEKMAKEMR